MEKVMKVSQKLSNLDHYLTSKNFKKMGKAVTVTPPVVTESGDLIVKKEPLTPEQKLSKLNEKAKANSMKALKSQVETFVAFGYSDEKKMKARLQAIQATLLEIESQIEPELPLI